MDIDFEEKTLCRDTVEHFLTDLMNQPALTNEFDPMVWHTMVERLTVIGCEDVTFRSGRDRDLNIESRKHHLHMMNR